jgi:RND family efflux transporter MFP subunit
LWIGALLVAGLAAGGGYGLVRGFSTSPHSHHDEPVNGDNKQYSATVAVQVVSPVPGGMDRTITQPGTVVADESVPLYAGVSGYLKELKVDIGSWVAKGDILAVIDVPELDAQLKWNEASVQRAAKKVAQMKALKKVYQADLKAAVAAVNQTEAAKKSAEAWRDFRRSEKERLEKLGKNTNIDSGVLKESASRYLASEKALLAATEAIVAAQARQDAVSAKIAHSDADVQQALAEVEVARAEKNKTQEQLKYATIKAPFDGVITQRSVLADHFIRSATVNTTQPPLLTVDKIDKVRVVVMVPDRDIIYTDVGDEALLEIDALPGKVFKAPISRIASAEDSKSRTMRVEIDLPNPNGRLLYQGMYGKVTITLEKLSHLLALPACCVINKRDNKGQVYVVKDQRAWLTDVTIGGVAGSKVGVAELKARDLVVANPQELTGNGEPVIIAHPEVVVQVVSPTPGGKDHSLTQPGTVVADQSVPLFAGVSGYLKTRNVDIGSWVRKGDVLAVIDVPELDAQLNWNEACVQRAGKKVLQMQAAEEVYQADLKAAKAAVKQSIAAKQSAAAWRDFREMEYLRLFKLGADTTIDAGVVDESFRRYLTSEEALVSAVEAIEIAKARQAAVSARIAQSEADVEEAQAEVEVARAEKNKTQEQLKYATIKAPFDGVITQRSVFVGHFIRAATVNATQPPMLTIEKIDKVRVVVMVPDADIIHTDVGDQATIEIDALLGKDKVFKAPISRIASIEDSKSRTMRVEIDVDNPKGKLLQGMYGKVTITLKKLPNVLELPACCVFNKIDNKGQIYVLKDQHACVTDVTLVSAAGAHVGVMELKADDQVIANPQDVPGNGAEVTVAQAKK